MNASELAQKMLEWEQKKRELDALTAEIETAVLEVAQTQTVGNVRATYSGGRKMYAYEETVLARNNDADAPVLQAHTTVVLQVQWKAVCDALGITDIPFLQTEPSVTVKLLK